MHAALPYLCPSNYPTPATPLHECMQSAQKIAPHCKSSIVQVGSANTDNGLCPPSTTFLWAV